MEMRTCAWISLASEQRERVYIHYLMRVKKKKRRLIKEIRWNLLLWNWERNFMNCRFGLSDYVTFVPSLDCWFEFSFSIFFSPVNFTLHMMIFFSRYAVLYTRAHTIFPLAFSLVPLKIFSRYVYTWSPLGKILSSYATKRKWFFYFGTQKKMCDVAENIYWRETTIWFDKLRFYLWINGLCVVNH